MFLRVRLLRAIPGFAFWVAILFVGCTGILLGRESAELFLIYSWSQDSKELIGAFILGAIAVGVAAILGFVLSVCFSGTHLRTLLSWTCVALALGFLTQGTVLANESQRKVNSEEIGAFIEADQTQQGPAVSARIVVSRSGELISLIHDGPEGPGRGRDVVWVAPKEFHLDTPDGCREEQNPFERQMTQLRCAPGTRVVGIVNLYTGTFPARLEALLSIQESPEGMGLPPSKYLPLISGLEVGFDTWDGTVRAFEQITVGQGRPTGDGAAFRAADQERGLWSAGVEVKNPKGATYMDVSRDLSLIILGGAFSWALMPAFSALTRRSGGASAPACTDCAQDCATRIRPGYRPRWLLQATLEKRGPK